MATMYNQAKFDTVVETLYAVRNNENDWGYALKACADLLTDVDIFVIEENKLTKEKVFYSSSHTGRGQDIKVVCAHKKQLFNELNHNSKHVNDDFLIFNTSLPPNSKDTTEHFKNNNLASIHQIFCYTITFNSIKFTFAIVLHADHSEFSEKQATICQRLAFHIKTAFLLLIAHKNLQSHSHLFFDIYNALDIPVFIANNLGNIDFMNTAAQQLLTENTHAVTEIPPLDTLSYQYLHRKFVLKPIDGINHFFVSNNLNFLVAEKTLINELSSYKLLLFLDIKLKENNETVQLIRNLYQLTPAELILTLELLKGASLTEFSTNYNISVNTSRTHLKSIFKKTNTTKQSELLSLLCRLVTMTSIFTASA
jgi:DNA-binding CsgD family transcriptional regulator